MARAPRVTPNATTAPTGRQPHAPKAISGYVHQPGYASGYAEGYRSLRGGPSLSRRAYLNKQAANEGWENYSQYSAVAVMAGGLGGMGSVASHTILGTLYNAGLDPDEFTTFAREHAAELRAVAANPEDVSAHGALARWLEALELREQDAPYDVGDTPHV